MVHFYNLWACLVHGHFQAFSHLFSLNKQFWLSIIKRIIAECQPVSWIRSCNASHSVTPRRGVEEEGEVLPGMGGRCSLNPTRRLEVNKGLLGGCECLDHLDWLSPEQQTVMNESRKLLAQHGMVRTTFKLSGEIITNKWRTG